MPAPAVTVAGAAGDAGRAVLRRAPARPAPEAPGALGEEVQSAFAYLPATLIGMLAGVGIVLWLFQEVAPPAWWPPWLAAFAVLWLLRLLMLRGYGRALRSGAIDWTAWHRLWVAATLASGALWGLTGWLFYGLGSGLQQTGLVIVLYSYCIAAVPVLANHRAVFFAFVGLSFVPLVTRIAWAGDADSLRLAGELVFIVGLTTLLVRSYGQALQRVTDLKLRADDLLAQLRAEKRAAEAARLEAEIANRAKTQFLAAASHDLRQPLHAMGLFAEALRQRSHAPDVARLVDSINESVDALEGLFSELLDITRIDSGGVTPQPVDFAVGDVFRRLRLHFEPTAFEKGLALRLRGDRHVLHADPLIVERIVRNLLSNAIRYTEDGAVLVGCRRRGDGAIVQVWDTGVGIPEAEQPRIFEEFYQVPGRRAVTADQRKGLGLGLAIVTRLAALIGARLTLRSVPGHGSVFTLEVPLGAAPAAVAAAAASPAGAGLTLEGYRILVVEDDAAVRDGLEVLLGGWGAEVVALPSLAATQALLATDGGAPLPPALLITDFRLADGTGLDVIAAVRGRHGPDVPALVVSGGTTPDLEARAQEIGFHLLAKPVLPSRLRAMIGFKLERRAPQA